MNGSFGFRLPVLRLWHAGRLASGIGLGLGFRLCASSPAVLRAVYTLTYLELPKPTYV